MQEASSRIILQHSAGPIRWMPSGSPHRAIINQRVYIVDNNNVLEIDGSTPNRFINPGLEHLPFDDPVIASLSTKYSGLRPLADGGIWEGLMTAITGQAVSLHSAAAFQRRLCTMLSSPIVHQDRDFWALPSAEQVAAIDLEDIRSIGITTKRAEGLSVAAKEFERGNIPYPPDDDIDGWMKELRKLPMVGPWTAASTLLWGLGHVDSYPSGDVALLRAAKLAYNDETLTMKDLDAMSERWRPQRSIAARLLWTNLLGMAWDD